MSKILKNIITGALMVSLMSSCESYDDLNTDPTRMSDATPGSFMNPVLYGMASYNWSRYNSWTFPLMQSLVSTSSTNGVGWYIFSDAAGDGTWTTYYKWATNVQAIYDKAVNEGDANYQAVALTLQSWIYQLLVDSFGDIPMEEACRGEEGIYYPKFNTQQEVYTDLIANLDKADSLYDVTGGLKYNTSGEMLYCTSESDHEGMKLWRKFNNSLRLRVLLRVIDVDGFDAASKIKNMLDNPDKYPVFGSNEESATVSISGVAPEEAPMTRPSDFTSYKVLSSFFIDKLKEWNDPRLSIFAKTTTNNGEVGYYGIESGYAILPSGNYSQPYTDNLAVAPMELMLMSYAEVLFIKTELAQRGVISDDAEVLYREAVTAAITQWGGEVTEDYFMNASAAYDGTLERIMEQKFYALFFCDYQQWFEYNRTGYPILPRGAGVANGDDMPKRFKYPSILQRTNANNYQAAKTSMGGDDFDVKLMWQK